MKLVNIEPAQLTIEEIEKINEDIQQLEVLSKRWNYDDNYISPVKKLLGHIKALQTTSAESSVAS